MDNPAIQGLITIIVGVGGCIGYFYFSNQILDKVIFPARGENAGRNINRANMVRPWLFLFPAIFALGLYLGYPVFETLRLSLTDRVPGGYEWAGLSNYSQMFSEPKFWEAIRNNMLWLIIVPAVSTGFGLLAAQLTDRISWGNVAKSLIFMPMAISLVGASVIFKLIYDARPADTAQIGVMNAVWMQFEGGIGSILFLQLLPSLILLCFATFVAYFGYVFLRPMWQRDGGHSAALLPLRILVAVAAVLLVWECASSALGLWTASFPYGEPQQWLTIPFWNSFLLMVVLIWIQTGFAMVILSAALRGIPEETVEAAIVDGANPFQIFFKIKVPQIIGTIVVVWTTITLTVLKVFDIVFAMTNGQWETQVLANYMYDKLFRANDWGVGSASAIIIMLMVMPILVWNVYNVRKEMR
ncbi:MAG: sugar ABC transporter permease [Rhodobacteraceae bacterium]|nr:sugar ABC transporter permease [Paracoccaceae bacterium]